MTDTATPETPDAPPPDPNAVNITINGRPHVARKGQLLIDAAKDAGEYVPRFCYHERMTPVGKCRMCLVECDSGRGPAVTVSCMVPVAPDMKVDTESPTTKRMQEGILELLLANHPLDCPVCDKGGECPLQDQAFSHGPGESRYVEEKRHYEKPIPISDLVFLDRERCILCDRCTRFADEVAGDPLIHFNSRGNNTHITTFPDAPFASYFSGNTVQICPVGALTAQPYRFKARPWDLSQQESTCTTCAVGCRTVVQSTRDQLVRVMGVDSDPVNHGWLCDRGRFNFEAIKSGDRVLTPQMRLTGDFETVTWNTAISEVAALINEAVTAAGASSVAIIGGSRGTNEDAFAWARLGHEVIGTHNVYAQMGDGLPNGLLGVDRATIDEAAAAPTVILLSPDLKEELPVLYLRLRRSAERRTTRIIEFAPRQTGLTVNAWKHYGYEPGNQGKAVAEALADPAVVAQLAKGPVVIVAGRANLAESTASTVAALQQLLAAVPGSKVLPAYRRGNVVGALQLGLHNTGDGLDVRNILKASAEGRIECLIVLGADPLTDFPDATLARKGIEGARRLVVVDSFLSATAQQASVVLPASMWAEKSGTTTNIEGRVTTVAQQVNPAGTARADWMIAAEIALELGTDLGYDGVAAITADIAASVPAYAALADGIGADGVVTAVPTTMQPLPNPSPTIAERNSYDFRLVVSRTLYDQAAGTVHSPSLLPLVESAAIHVHPLDLDRVGATEGASVRVSNSRGSTVMKLAADTTVVRGTAWVPFNRPGTGVGELIDCFADVNDVRIETL